MPLSNDLISEFVKATRDDKKTPQETTLYGTVVYDGKPYVKLDGSDLLTPVTTTTGVNDGDRVTVLIKDHSAVVTGNVSSPSASQKDVVKISDEIASFEQVIADKVSTDELAAELANIETLIADKAAIKDLEAAKARIDSLEAVDVTITGKLEAAEAEIDTLQAEKINADIVEATYATIESLEATNVKVHNLEAAYGDFEDLTTERLEAAEAEIDNLEVKKLDVNWANIDLANIDKATIGELFSESGIIKDLIVSEGTITGELVGVTIKGDLIEAGTLKADKLVVKGSDGLYYKLNIEAGAVASAEVSEEELQNGLHGTAIIAKTITAEKIAVDDLTAFNAYLAGFNVKELQDDDGEYLTSAIYSGVKESVHNSTPGIYMDKDGQLVVGNSSEHLKFYLDEDGEYHLDIAARSITLGTGKTVEETIEEATDIQIGARNLIRNSKTLNFIDYWFINYQKLTSSTSVLAEATLGDMILGEE